ncbi:MAG: hypothetical protein K9G46_07100 [Flavobacteriales bacterium]|nr:hypothetical protein [Flavobacteriales bacterium]
MSRTVERFGRTGFITKNDGKCWQVRLREDGSVLERNRVQDGFPFYSPNCKRIKNYIAGIGGDSFPTERAGWEVLESSIGVDANGYHHAYILRDRLYNRDYWVATKNGDTYGAVNVGSNRPAPFRTDEEITEILKPPIHIESTTDYPALALKALAVITTIALIYFGTRTLLKSL